PEPIELLVSSHALAVLRVLDLHPRRPALYEAVRSLLELGDDAFEVPLHHLGEEVHAAPENVRQIPHAGLSGMMRRRTRLRSMSGRSRRSRPSSQRQSKATKQAIGARVQGDELGVLARKPLQIECEEGDLNPHGFYPTSPSNDDAHRGCKTFATVSSTNTRRSPFAIRSAVAA